MIATAALLLDALPQTQCTRCGFPDCAGYAQAVADARADINQCPPGGADGVARLSRLTGLPAKMLDPAFGVEGPRKMAVIDEAWCIGCTKCLDACPTDAILGIHKRMHTVIDVHCTGCELCVPVCPVDCIAMETVTPGRSGWQAWSAAQAEHARERYAARRARLDRLQDKAAIAPLEPPTETHIGPVDPAQEPKGDAAEPPIGASDRKRATVEAALARAKAASAGRFPRLKP